ncbi:MAG: amidohydrolase family protein [Desulfobacteraceae bacterium]|nr:amidohydrolase family protein [Desulfobacteraceae bacterium]
MVVFLMSEDNVRMQLQHSAMMIGTDDLGLATEGPMASGMLHPRCFGTYPRVFGEYVREEGILSLEEASWKSSGFPAQKLRLTDRGVIKKGCKADLVVLYPVTVKDRATYTEPLQYPSGIEYVLVNGEIVIEQGKQTNARPGKVIRLKS